MTGSPFDKTTSTGTSFDRGAAGDESTQWRTRTDRSPADAQHGQRIEPSVGDHAFPRGPSDAYERLHGLGPEFGEIGYPPPARTRLRRFTTMVTVFIVGAGVGLAAAWWFHKPPALSPVSATASPTVSSVPATPSSSGRRATVIRGISPSELPYDGAPPPAEVQPDPEPVAARVPAAPEATSGAPSEPQVGERRSGAADIDQGAPAEKPTAASESAPVRQADDAPKVARTVKQGASSETNAAPKRKSATRTDREIERIRRQVDEELKKKTVNGRPLSDARTGASNDRKRKSASAAGAGSVARISATRTSLARCDRKSNFIRRELCRWEVCNGSWGRNGCPSYQQQASTY